MSKAFTRDEGEGSVPAVPVRRAEGGKKRPITPEGLRHFEQELARLKEQGQAAPQARLATLRMILQEVRLEETVRTGAGGNGTATAGSLDEVPRGVRPQCQDSARCR